MLIKQFVEEKWPDVPADYDALSDPRDRLTFILKLLDYITPRMKSVEVSQLNAQKVDQLTENQVDLLLAQLTGGNHNE